MFERVEALAQSADLAEMKLLANLLESTVVSHADLEDALLRPEIRQCLPSTSGPTDHQQIRAGLERVTGAAGEGEARRCLRNIGHDTHTLQEGRIDHFYDRAA